MSETPLSPGPAIAVRADEPDPGSGQVAPSSPDRRTSPVELLWDLVFVFAVTQVTTLLAHRATWGRFGEAMLALALVWWAWSAFVWAANAEAADSRALRAYLLAATALIFVVGLALPQAFGRSAVLFAVSYALVRLIHLALYVDASRQGNAAGSAIAGFAVTVVVGMALLVVGAVFLQGFARVALWIVAAGIDYAGPAWLTRDRLRGLQRVAVEHFAERYSSFVIICLGESILAIGAGLTAGNRHVTPSVVLAGVLALIIAMGLWWTYFDRFAEDAQLRLREHPDPVIAAADAYSYIHLIMVAGIIIFAAGVRLVVHDPLSMSMPIAGRLALCGGVAVYLLGLSAFRLRLTGELGWARPAGAVIMLGLYAVGGGLPAWTIFAATAALVALLCGAETLGRAG